MSPASSATFTWRIPSARARAAARALRAIDAWRAAAARPPLGEVHVDRVAGVTLYTDRGVGVRLGVVDDTLPARLAALRRRAGALDGGGEEARVVYVDNRARPDRVTVKLASASQSATWIERLARIMAKREELVVGLDIGTTKIACIVGEITDDGLDIIGVGTHPSTGLKKGVVVNIDATVRSIQRAVEEAEHMAGVEITSVYAGIAGAHIKSLNSQGVWAVKDKEVNESDIAAVLEQAKAINIPQDREIIHVLPQEYTIDHQDGIKEPLGMSRRAPRGQGAPGDRVGDERAEHHQVLPPLRACRWPTWCSSRWRRREAVLHDDEKELGVALIDIGGGTTDLAIFSDGVDRAHRVLAVGGHQLTADIAYGLRTPALGGRAHQAQVRLRDGFDGRRGRDDGGAVGGRTTGARRSSGSRCAPSSSRASKRSSCSCGARSRRAATRTSWRRARSSPAARPSSKACPSWPKQVLGMPVRRGSPKGVGGLVDVVQDADVRDRRGPRASTARRTSARPTSPARDADKRTVWQRMRSWFGEVF